MLTDIAIVALAAGSALLVCYSGHCFGRAFRIIWEADKRGGERGRKRDGTGAGAVPAASVALAAAGHRAG